MKRTHDYDLFTRLCEAWGLPRPVREHRFHLTRKWRIDYAWPDIKLALEVEGGVWTAGRHTRGLGFMRDMEKYNALAEAGWTLIRTTPGQLRTMAMHDQLHRIIHQLSTRHS